MKHDVLPLIDFVSLYCFLVSLSASVCARGRICVCEPEREREAHAASLTTDGLPSS